jgi:ubiquinone/menaquinone biosynthesis C-methylase UbiE
MNKDVKNKIQLNSLLLPFKNNQFKGIIIQGGLHHLDDFDQIVICLREAKRVLKSNGYLFISEPGNTLCLKIWLFLIKKTKLWKISSYSKNWHDLYKAEEKTHSLYLSNTSKLIHYLKNNWTIEFHKVGLVTEFFTLKKDD